MAADYRSVVDALAADIAAGRLRAGERLPPQRDFAFRRGIAVSTAARIYAELGRRGLVSGEIGRGTYVTATPVPAGPSAVEPSDARVDLELNFPVLPEQSAIMGEAIARLATSPAMLQSLRSLGARGTAAGREIAARFLAQDGWRPLPEQILFTGNGRQAIASVLAALVPPGERVGVEALTYPIVKGIAGRLGITLVPLAVDEDGLRPDALAAAQRAHRLRAVYLQPTLHNPLGLVMSAERRAELAGLFREADLYAVEDRVYSFLVDEEPLAALLPERSIVVDSMSKRMAPGLTLGFVVAPPGLVDKLVASIRSGAWLAQGFPYAASLAWMGDGTAGRLMEAKRSDASVRQALARRHLADFAVRGDARAYHIWVELPEPWRAELFAGVAARRGIALTPAAAFTIGAGHAPNAVRLAMAAPSLEVLDGALAGLRALIRSGPDAASFD